MQVIAPYTSKKTKIFEKVWKYDVQNSTIAVGWLELGDISRFKSKDELRRSYKEVYPEEKNPSTITRDINTIWRFYHDIEPGDKIIARRGRKIILGIGTVQDPKKVYFEPEEGKERIDNLTDRYYPNIIKVNWDDKKIEFDKQVFSFYTMYEIPEEKYNNLVQGKVPEEAEEKIEEQTEEEKTELYLEKYLEEIIARNFNGLFKNQLELYEDEEGNTGQQFSIVGENGREIGRIDILAKEPKTNSYVVIELKKGRKSSKVVGQILSYMGWVKENLCEEGQNVKGLIICKEGDERLNNALMMVSDMIDLKFYKLNLELRD